jgi:hypothetical protein
MMMYGDKYDYFWVDKGGSTYTEFAVNSMEYQKCSWGKRSKTSGMVTITITLLERHSHGSYGNEFSTHLLRLADVYLIYAEAVLGNSFFYFRPKALKAFNDVRKKIGKRLRAQVIHYLGRYLERTSPRTCL